jgi:hypothetical protein
VSNPWPARIEIRSVAPEDGGCRVDGDVVYVVTADTVHAVDRRAVSIHVEAGPPARVTDFRWTEEPAEPAASSSAPGVDDSTAPHIRDAANVVRQYYRDIQNREFAAAYARWSDDGRATGKTREAFANGFANTTAVAATVADSGTIEGAAGSQYVTVPVRVEATLRNGTQQHFAGTYTLRRAMVDGATRAQRQWHIFKADLRESRR